MKSNLVESDSAGEIEKTTQPLIRQVRWRVEIKAKSIQHKNIPRSSMLRRANELDYELEHNK